MSIYLKYRLRLLLRTSRRRLIPRAKSTPTRVVGIITDKILSPSNRVSMKEYVGMQFFCYYPYDSRLCTFWPYHPYLFIVAFCNDYQSPISCTCHIGSKHGEKQTSTWTTLAELLRGVVVVTLAS